jgi:MarR family 2-MHQ and catechol resistance regulon transcriptional repressor
MPTHYQGNRREKQALDTYIKLLRGSQALNERLTPLLEDAGLSGSQFGVLEALYHLGPLCMKALAEKILRTSGNLTLVIKNLERDGLVNRKQEANDRRYFTIHLTEKGKKLIERVFPKHVQELTDAMSALEVGEQQELARLAKKLGLGTER